MATPKVSSAYQGESGTLSFRKMAEAAAKDPDWEKKLYETDQSEAEKFSDINMPLPGTTAEAKIEAGKAEKQEPAPVTSSDVTTQMEKVEESKNAPEAKVVQDSSDSKPENIETVFVRGPDGKKVKLEIDYSNREAVKRAHMQAAGMRKFQVERDAAIKKAEETAKSLAEKATHYDDLEQSWAQGGVRGLINRLGPEGEKDFKAAVDAEIKRREYLSGLTPEEKTRLELKEREEYANKRATEVESKYQKMLNDIEADKLAAAKQEFASRLTPSFDRYRFAGKLGDASLERFYDKSIWNEAREIIDAYPEGVERTPALIDKTFRQIAQKVRATLKENVEKQVQSVIDKKSTEAMKTIQVTTQKGLTSQDVEQSAIQLAAQGKLKKAMSLFRGN